MKRCHASCIKAWCLLMCSLEYAMNELSHPVPTQAFLEHGTGRVLLDDVPEEARRMLCWDLISVRGEGGKEISLRRHLERTLSRSGGPAALLGRTVWSYWYADTSMVDWSLGDIGPLLGGPTTVRGSSEGQVLQHRSPVRGNWYEAKVLAVDVKDSVIKVGEIRWEVGDSQPSKGMWVAFSRAKSVSKAILSIQAFYFEHSMMGRSLAFCYFSDRVHQGRQSR